MYFTAMFAYAADFNQDIGNWNVSSADYFEAMFEEAKTFNQDLSQWCVEYQEEEPEDFRTGATSWTEPQPVWGTCP